MRSFWRQANLKNVFIILAATLLFYLPILIKPAILLNRGNDLEEYYWPIAHYTKIHVSQDKVLPYWNNMFFSGTPLLPDPQSMLFYPFNFILILLPTDYAFVFWLVLHTFIGGFGAYSTSRKGFGFSKPASLFCALVYIVFPRTAGFLEAGHITLTAMTAWLPYLTQSSIALARRPSFFWMIVWALSLVFLFFTFPTIFAAATFISILFILVLFYFDKKNLRTLTLVLSGLFTVTGVIAITLLPQLEWIPQTTRLILLNDRSVYPIWEGVREFIQALFPHILGGKDMIITLDSEKWIANGILLTIFAVVGFSTLHKKYKIIVLSLLFLVVLVSLNNVSPFRNFLLSSDWYVLARVATRNWFIVVLVIVFLAGYGFEKLTNGRLKKLAIVLGGLALLELIALSWFRLSRPVPPQNTAPKEVYEFLKRDPGLFRAFCTTRCLSQKDVALNGIQTIEGYATIYQKNYYDQFIQLSQVFWDKYSSTLPPFAAYKYGQIQPIASILGEHNVKYVISPHTLNDKQFVKVAQFGEYLIFENAQFRTRAYFYIAGKTPEIEAPILQYSPNRVTIDVTKHKAGELVFAQTWSSGWKAKTDTGKRITVEETLNHLMRIKIEPTTQFIEFYYYPESYRLGKTIGIFITALLLLKILFLLRSSKRPN